MQKIINSNSNTTFTGLLGTKGQLDCFRFFSDTWQQRGIIVAWSARDEKGWYVKCLDGMSDDKKRFPDDKKRFPDKACIKHWKQLKTLAHCTEQNRNLQDVLVWKQEPITRSLQLPHIPVTAFSQTDLFFTLNLSRIQIPTGTSMTNCNHKHGLIIGWHADMMSTCSRLAALFYPYRCVLM